MIRLLDWIYNTIYHFDWILRYFDERRVISSQIDCWIYYFNISWLVSFIVMILISNL